jgi:hypothetical protein
MAELLDPYFGRKGQMLRDPVPLAAWVSLMPGGSRLRNALYQSRYYDWVAGSLDCAFSLLPKPQTVKLFNVLANMYYRSIQYYKNTHQQAGTHPPHSLGTDLNSSPDGSLLESSTVSSGSLIDKDEEEVLEFQEADRDYYDLLTIIERAPLGAKFSERLVEFLCTLEGGGVLLEAVFEEEDVAMNFKLFQSMVVGSLIWGAGSHRAMATFTRRVPYLAKLGASIVPSPDCRTPSGSSRSRLST